MQLLILSLFILSLTACKKDEAKEVKEEHIMPTPITAAEPANIDKTNEDTSDEDLLNSDDFLMVVDNTFYLDRGLIVTGKISSGSISVDELIDSGVDKVNVIKEIREITGCGLKEAKELVDNVPSEIIKKISSEKAEEIKTSLEELGATVEIIEQE